MTSGTFASISPTQKPAGNWVSTRTSKTGTRNTQYTVLVLVRYPVLSTVRTSTGRSVPSPWLGSGFELSVFFTVCTL